MPDREEPEMGTALTLTADQMRELGQQATEILVARLQGLDADAAWQGASRTELEARLREPPPEQGLDPQGVMQRVAREVLPLAARVDHPRFFAFVPSTPTWPGVIADYLSAGFNIFQGTWLGSAGPSQIELVVLDWFRDWVGYPDTAGGLFTSGGSAASLNALVAAREFHGAPAKPAVFMSDQSHSALERAARIIGVRPEGIFKVTSDAHYRIDLAALSQSLQAARAAGFTPIAICANAGTTNTGAVDPMNALADLCAAEKIWLHVDAAYGGFAVLDERGKALLAGMERADSITLDAHKWLFQPFEAGCLLLRDLRHLERAFSVNPDYMQDTRLGMEQVNFADRGLQLTRSFRALKVWMSIQTFGMAAFRQAVGRGIEFAQRAEAWVKAQPGLELLSPASLGIVCFRLQPEALVGDEAALDRLNESAQAALIKSGYAMISSTRLQGRYSLRLCIMAHHTTWEDVEGTLSRLVAFYEAPGTA